LEIDPMPAGRRVTLADLARGFNQLHQCHERTQADVVLIKRELGLAAGGRRVSGLSSSWQAFRRTAAATASTILILGLAYKIAVLAAPGIWLAARALGHALLKGVI
jgi:hypothetical protein